MSDSLKGFFVLLFLASLLCINAWGVWKQRIYPEEINGHVAKIESDIAEIKARMEPKPSNKWWLIRGFEPGWTKETLLASIPEGNDRAGSFIVAERMMAEMKNNGCTGLSIKEVDQGVPKAKLEEKK